MKAALTLVAALSAWWVTAADDTLIGSWNFKESLKGWGCDGRAERVETAAMSGVWVLRATGPVRVVLNRKITDWEADREYTLVVRMRSVGEGSKLLAIQRTELPGGGIGEGTYLANMAVGGEWHEYFFPFKTAKDRKPCGITFLKVDSGAPGTGMEVEWMRLHRGKISSFEIRRIGRPGRQTPTPGTEIPIPANRFGAAAKKIRALALVDSVVNLRETLRIFEGTGATVDVICTTGKDQDVYTTDSDPAEVKARLEKGGWYDVYLVGRKTAPRIGGEMAAYVVADVRRGAGLYFAENRDHARFAAALAEVKDGRLGKGLVDLRAYSKEIERQPNFYRKFVTLDPENLTDEGLDFPYEDIAFAVTAADVWKIARGRTPAPVASLRRKVVDVYGGERHELVWHRDGKKRTVGFDYRKEPLSGTRLGAFEDDGEVSKACIEGGTAGVKLEWEFTDFDDRLFARGEGSGADVRFKIPREKLYTNLGVVKMRLVKGDRVLDRRTEAIYVKGNDVGRLMDDYGVSMWPMSGPTPFRDAAAMFRSLEKVGFTATFMPMGGLDAYAVAYRSGMAVAGPYVVGGEYFSGSPKAKDNVRYPVFNSAQARKDIEALAERRARRMSRYGVYHTAFSDEATLGPPDQEVDAHPENVAEYRRRMEKKYGTIAEYNRRHRTAHASFSDLGSVYVKDARAEGNAAEFVEWRNFNVDRWVEVIKLVVDTSKRINPDVRVSLDNSFGETAFGGNDYWKLLTKTGLDYSKEYTSMVHFGREPFNVFDEYYRSFRPDMRVWGWTGYAFTRPRERFLPWWTAAHRYGGFTWFAATYWGINLIDLPSGAITLDALELGESLRDSRMLKGLGKTLTLWPWVKNDVALYYSHDSAIVSTFLGKETKDKEMLKGGPFHDFSHSRLGAQFLVEDLLYQHDFVAPEQVVGGKLVKDGYRILFMPRIISMSDAEVAAVKAFAAAGGKVVADVMPGDYDELGVRRAANPFAAAEIETIGKNFSDLDPAQREWALRTLKSCKATSALVSPTIVSSFGREAMHYSSGGADLYVVLRMPGRSKDDAEETFEFGREGYVYDVRARKPLGRADRVKTKVPLNEAAAFAVLGEKLDGVTVRGTPAEVKRGDTLKLGFEIESKDVSPRFMLHVEIVPPGEKEVRFHFRRNLETAGGKAELEFPLALDDPAGRWKIRVTEPLTGVSGEESFVLK